MCVLHGIFMLAGIAVALDDRITATEALSLVHYTDPRALVIGPSVVHNLGERGLTELGADHIAPSDDPERLALVPIRGHHLEHTRVDWSLEDAGDEILGSDARPADHAVIFYSSGSTGKPKARSGGRAIRRFTRSGRHTRSTQFLVTASRWDPMTSSSRRFRFTPVPG